MRLFDRTISRPTLFVLATTVVAIGLGMLALRLGGSGSATIGSRGPRTVGFTTEGAGLRAAIVGIVALLTASLHMIAYYRRAMSRHAVVGGTVLVALLSAVLALMVWRNERGQPSMCGSPR